MRFQTHELTSDLQPRTEHRPSRVDEWTRTHPGASSEVSELTVGVLGYGRIGSRVARMAAALGSRVVATKRSADAPAPAFRTDGRRGRNCARHFVRCLSGVCTSYNSTHTFLRTRYGVEIA